MKHTNKSTNLTAHTHNPRFVTVRVCTRTVLRTGSGERLISEQFSTELRHRLSGFPTASSKKPAGHSSRGGLSLLKRTNYEYSKIFRSKGGAL